MSCLLFVAVCKDMLVCMLNVTKRHYSLGRSAPLGWPSSAAPVSHPVQHTLLSSLAPSYAGSLTIMCMRSWCHIHALCFVNSLYMLALCCCSLPLACIVCPQPTHAAYHACEYRGQVYVSTWRVPFSASQCCCRAGQQVSDACTIATAVLAAIACHQA